MVVTHEPKRLGGTQPAYSNVFFTTSSRKGLSERIGQMATLAMINGILIRMKPEKNGRHHRAHIHAWYSGKEAVFDVLLRRKVKGDFPRDQTLIVQGFIAAHEAELLANWESLNSENGTFFKIEP